MLGDHGNVTIHKLYNYVYVEGSGEGGMHSWARRRWRVNLVNNQQQLRKKNTTSINPTKTARPGLDTVKGPLREHTAT